MKSYEIYKFADPVHIEEMLMFFREEDRNLYKTTLATLAASRKLRPVFVQKKPVVDQIKWMNNALRFKPNADIGEHMLQVWFMKAKPEVLVAACDGLGIEHNGEGYVEGELPKTLDDKKLSATIDTLIEKFGQPLASIYFYIFNLQIPNGWDNLSELLKTDERISLNLDESAPAPAKKAPAKKEAKAEKKAPAKKATKKAAAKKAAKKKS